MDKRKLNKELVLVRNELFNVLDDIKSKKITLNKANSITYCASNIIRSIGIEIYLNKKN